ncbi:MAG TPA: hypothetical protein VK841_01640, partial [Polyangiaceae bacterium]|nr:hypothetical protein [Polyangiaceae bacterium]
RAQAVGSAQGGQSFTPTSYLLPIESIVLTSIDPDAGSASSGGGPLYQCPALASPGSADAATGDAGNLADATLPSGSGDASLGDASDASQAGDPCWVDMADNAALSALFAAPANVPPGTYNAIVVNSCSVEGSYQALLKGSVSYGGTTYYTTPSPTVLTTSQTEEDYVAVAFQGCSTAVMLAQPLTVQAGDTLTISAFFTLDGIAWLIPDAPPGLGGCAAGPSSAPNVCSGLPELVASVGTVTPNLSTFLVTEDPSDLDASKAGGAVLLLTDDGVPFSGFLRRVYSPTALVPSVTYDVPLRSVVPNQGDAGLVAAPDGGDGGGLGLPPPPVYTVTSYGDPATDPTQFRVRFPEFLMTTHSGIFETANGASMVNYRAVLQ